MDDNGLDTAGLERANGRERVRGADRASVRRDNILNNEDMNK